MNLFSLQYIFSQNDFYVIIFLLFCDVYVGWIFTTISCATSLVWYTLSRQILFIFELVVLCSFYNYIVNRICFNSNIINICRYYKSRKWFTLSVKIYLLLPSLPLSIWLCPIISPPPNLKSILAILASDCQFHLIPILQSHNFNNLVHNLSYQISLTFAIADIFINVNIRNNIF